MRRSSAQNIIAILFVTAVTLVLQGCAGVQVSQREQRGLFQNNSTTGSRAAKNKRAIASVDRELENDTLDPRFGAGYRIPAGEISEHGFLWPVNDGYISSPFGRRKRDFHEGIDISAPKGTEIHAAKDGVVIYSSRKIRGYGNMIVLKHENSTATVYAHNKKNLVKKGDIVKKGQLIGLVGATGKATGSHVHFEVRRGELPNNPLSFLAPMRAPAQASATSSSNRVN